MKRFLSAFVLIFFGFLATLATVVPARADLTLVTNRGTGYIVDWAQFGPVVPGGTPIANGTTASSVPSGIVTQVNGDNLKIFTQNSSGPWQGNFSDGDIVLDNMGTGAIRLDFSPTVYGSGAQIQYGTYGSFAARIEAFNNGGSMGYFTVPGSSSGNNDGSAIFLGVSSTTPISYLTFSIVGNDAEEFAINRLTLNSNPVPLPPPAYLLGFGLAFMIYRQRRK